ncbi:hypothetical protein CEK62_19995 (plasmid) [Alcanivorax sp. N3-2A]|nr:hypothetical protein CEK62_01815 [Alcanivorax sp. N3-2A]ASK36653.1 hypothetical protein CEK62_19995 [Alcanivorax sp. N3-2A]
MSPRKCGLFCICVWQDLATGGSVKHRLSMASKLVLSVDDAMIDADTMLHFLMCSWYQVFITCCFVWKK